MSMIDDLLSTINGTPKEPGNPDTPVTAEAAPENLPELEPGWYSDEFKNYVGGSGK